MLLLTNDDVAKVVNFEMLIAFQEAGYPEVTVWLEPCP